MNLSPAAALVERIKDAMDQAEVELLGWEGLQLV
jgi:hypothetical protein